MSAPSKTAHQHNGGRIKWGILGTGGIARTFAQGLATSDSGELVAVGSRELSSARNFAEKEGAQRGFGSYDELLADPGVEAVYIATPHPLHCELTLRAARAGKHVLCEKPLGMNVREVEAMIAAARAADILLMEAFMYRCHPQTAKVVEMIRSGILGTIHSVQATFSFHNRSEITSRFYSKELGGGGILDVGCYPVSLSRLVAGAAAGKAFLDPLEVRAVGVLHPITGIDLYTSAVLRFENGVVAQVATGVAVEQENAARIYGSEGWVQIPQPWLPQKNGGVAKILWQAQGEPLKEIDVAPSKSLYSWEADAFGRALRHGQRNVPEMSLDDSLGNARTLDRWRKEIGLSYAAD